MGLYGRGFPVGGGHVTPCMCTYCECPCLHPTIRCCCRLTGLDVCVHKISFRDFNKQKLSTGIRLFVNQAMPCCFIRICEVHQTDSTEKTRSICLDSKLCAVQCVLILMHGLWVLCRGIVDSSLWVGWYGFQMAGNTREIVLRSCSVIHQARVFVS